MHMFAGMKICANHHRFRKYTVETCPQPMCISCVIHNAQEENQGFTLTVAVFAIDVNHESLSIHVFRQSKELKVV